MAKILRFQTRAERASNLVPAELPQVPESQFKTLYTASLVHCQALTTMFQSTGKFNAACEQMMIQVVHTIRDICTYISGTTGDDNAPTKTAG